MTAQDQHGAGPERGPAPPPRGPPARAGAGQALDPRLTDLAGRIFFNLRVALANTTLYPPGSKQALRGTAAVFGLITEFLETAGRFEVAEADRTALVNGHTPAFPPRDRAAAEHFLALMLRQGLKSVLAKPGLHLEELNEFLTLLANPGPEGPDECAERLAQRRFPHLELNRRQFVSVTEKDLVIARGAELLERSQGGLEGVMRLIHQVMEMTTGLADQSERDAARVQIAQAILEKDPALLEKMLPGARSPAADSPAQPAPAAPAGGPDPEVVREAVASINRALGESLAEVPPGSRAAAGIESVRRTVTSLLRALGAQDVALHLLALFEDGRIEDSSPSPTPGPAAPGAASAQEASALLEQPEIALLGDEERRRLPELLRQLDLADRPDLVEGLAGRLAANVGASTSEIRLRAARFLGEQLGSLEQLSARGALEQVDRRLLEQEEQETDPTVYLELGRLMVRRADSVLREGNLNRLREIVGAFRRHHESPGGFAERRAQAMNCLRELGRQEVMDSLLQEALAGDAAAFDRVYPVLVKLGNAAVEPVVAALRVQKDAEGRHRLGRIIKGLGQDGAAVLAERLAEEQDSLAAHRLTEALRHTGEERLLLEGLRRLLDHQDPLLRLEAVRALKEKGGEAAGRMLFGRLDDGDARVRLALVAALGELGYAPAAEALAGLIHPVSKFSHEEEPRLQEEACLALGHLGGPRALAALAEVLTPARLIQRPKPAAVQAAAARALNRLGTPEALRVLASGQQLKEETLRHLCRDLFLRRIAALHERLAAAEDIRLVAGEAELAALPGGFAGRVELLPLAALFRKLAELKRTGTLFLLLGEGRGKIAVEQGQPRTVEFPPWHGPEALPHLLAHHEGEFLFSLRH